jgi:hypothetical protein
MLYFTGRSNRPTRNGSNVVNEYPDLICSKNRKTEWKKLQSSVNGTADEVELGWVMMTRYDYESKESGL